MGAAFKSGPPAFGPTPAVLTIDLQYDFFDVRGHPGAGRLAKAVCIPAVRQLLHHGRANGWKVVHLTTKHSGEQTLPAHLQRRQAGAYCVLGTAGAEIVEGLYDPGDTILEKQHFDGFSNPELARILKDHESLIVTGIATDCCVLYTAHSAASVYGKHVYLPYQAVAASTLEDYASSLRGAEKSTATIIDMRDLLKISGPARNLESLPRLRPEHINEQISNWFREQLRSVNQIRATLRDEMPVPEILRQLEEKLSSSTDRF